MLTNIISWNTFGAAFEKLTCGFSNILNSGMANIILLQEAGSFDESQYAKIIHQKIGRDDYTGYFVKDAKARVQRCTTGILLQSKFFNNWEFGDLDSGHGRPVVIAYDRNNPDSIIATVHAVAEKHTAQAEISRIINNHMIFKPKWFLMGDFNCEPDQLIAPNIVSAANVSSPSCETQTLGHTIDYAIFSDHYIGTKVEIASKSDYVPLLSDHYPIRAIIDI